MNQYRGEIKGVLGGKERTFKVTFESIVNIENRTGKSIMTLTHDIALSRYAMKDIVIVLHEGLLGMKSNVVQEAVGDMVMKSGLKESSDLAAKIIETIFTGETKGEENPLVEAENKEKTTP